MPARPALLGQACWPAHQGPRSPCGGTNPLREPRSQRKCHERGRGPQMMPGWRWAVWGKSLGREGKRGIDSGPWMVGWIPLGPPAWFCQRDLAPHPPGLSTSSAGQGYGRHARPGDPASWPRSTEREKRSPLLEHGKPGPERVITELKAHSRNLAQCPEPAAPCEALLLHDHRERGVGGRTERLGPLGAETHRQEMTPVPCCSHSVLPEAEYVSGRLASVSLGWSLWSAWRN